MMRTLIPFPGVIARIYAHFIGYFGSSFGNFSIKMNISHQWKNKTLAF